MLPPPSEDRRVAELTRRVENLESALRAAFTTISGGAGIRIVDGGSITVDGGNIKVTSANGVDTFYVGGLLPALPDGSRQPGLIFRREDGTIAMALYDPIPSVGDYHQFLAMYDRQGNVVVSDDTDSGEGGARPWLSYPTPEPTSVAAWPSTTSTSWGTIAQSFASMERPKVWWSATVTTDAGVSGQVRLSLGGGAALGPVHDVVAGTPTYINDVITLPTDYFGGQWSVDVTARVSGGTGAIRCQTWAVVGRQT